MQVGCVADLSDLRHSTGSRYEGARLQLQDPSPSSRSLVTRRQTDICRGPSHGLESCGNTDAARHWNCRLVTVLARTSTVDRP